MMWVSLAVRRCLAAPALGLVLSALSPQGAEARRKPPGFGPHNPRPVTGLYVRPPRATSDRQKRSVQGLPCISCGRTAPRMHADHTWPLSQQHYIGILDPKTYRAPGAVRPQCPRCSGQQGALLKQEMRPFREFFRKKPLKPES